MFIARAAELELRMIRRRWNFRHFRRLQIQISFPQRNFPLAAAAAEQKRKSALNSINYSIHNSAGFL